MGPRNNHAGASLLSGCETFFVVLKHVFLEGGSSTRTRPTGIRRVGDDLCRLRWREGQFYFGRKALHPSIHPPIDFLLKRQRLPEGVNHSQVSAKRLSFGNCSRANMSVRAGRQPSLLPETVSWLPEKWQTSGKRKCCCQLCAWLCMQKSMCIA